MSQEDVINVLKKNKKPMAYIEILKELGFDRGYKSVYTSINKLLEFNEISCIELSRNEARKKYNIKRRMRLYYLPNGK